MINKQAKNKKWRRLAVPYTRGLRIELLEDRRLLAIMVNTLEDVQDFSISDGSVSLRDAIALAPSGGTIGFSVTGTIGLSLGQLSINKDLTIAGPGADLLTIDQNTGSSRVFNIDDGNSTNDKTVSISGLTLTGGQVSGINNRGGAIHSRENLTLTACTISGNGTTDTIGGGIEQNGGSLAISASTISGNTARSGGGLSLSQVNATIDGSTISGNQAQNLSGGFSLGSGGGISAGLGSLLITNSTISGNSASHYGGGIYLSIFSYLTVEHGTITGNRSGANGGTDFDLGGGIAVTSYSAATLDHAIVAGNFRGTGATPADIGVDFSGGAVLAAHSLIGDNTGVTITDNGGNLIGTTASPIDPLLGPLGDNGGRTWTHALSDGSPAIDAGDPAIASPPTNDQRGAPFGRIADGDGAGGARIDVGAYERQTVAGLSLVVDTLVDESDGNYSSGDFSLREAIGLANGSAGPDTITFAAALSGQTILLGGTELLLTEALTIDATALADNVAINAQQNSRIFNITATTGDFTLGGLTLTGGRITVAGLAGGGAIRSLTTGHLTLDQSIVRGNSAAANGVRGGGIYAGGAVTLTQSTVSGNSASAVVGSPPVASAAGGGIFAAGPVTLNQSTVSGNSASAAVVGSPVFSAGGGICARGEVTLTQSTVSGNSTAGDGANGGGISASDAVTLTQSTVTDNHASMGGGVFQDNPAPFTINGSIVAGNTGSGEGADLVKGPSSTLTVTVNYSLIGVTPLGGFQGVGNTTGLAPRLGPLANNGGPTQTHVLLADSPAIDAGDPSIVFNPTQFDARGAPFVRVFDGDSGGGARIDIGATERQTLVGLSLAVDTLVDEYDGNYSSGDFSLREAISLANGSADPDTITFAAALSGQTILLGGSELDLAETVTIDATALVDNVAINAQQNSRIFNITATTDNFNLAGLMLTGGRTTGNNSIHTFTDTFSGGAIRSLTTGHLTLDQSTISGNSTAGSGADGGGILAVGSVTLTQSTVSGNSTAGSGAYGGGIHAVGSVTLTQSTVSGNSTAGSGAVGGGILAVGSVTLTQSTVSGNSTAGSGADGGGILAVGSVTLTQSTVSGNSTAGSGAYGGGIHAGGAVTLTQSTVSGNSTTDYGGGIHARGAVTLTQSTVSGNSTAGYRAHGGGIWSFGSVMLTQSTVSGNSTAGDSANGGGIWAAGAVILTQSTVSGNSTAGSGANGGGIWSYGSVTLTQSTVTDNHALHTNTMGGGVFRVNLVTPDHPFLISSSIVAGNTAGGDGADLFKDTGGTLAVNYSLIGDNSGTSLVEAPVGSPDANGNLIGGPANGAIDPLLGPLGDNGGPTFTHALLGGSPGIDAGDPAAMAGLGNVPLDDQRGAPFGRVDDGNGDSVARIDMGAYEYLVAPMITGLRVGSTAWASSFKTFVDPALALGYMVPAGAAPLPWTNVNQLSITFSEPVEQPDGGQLDADDFLILGVNVADYASRVSGPVYYDEDTNTATISFNQAFGPDKLRVFIDSADVVDAAGNPLSADYSFRLDVLPGDVSRNGGVNTVDVGQTKGKQGQFLTPGMPPTPSIDYSIFHDVNGNNGINTVDVGQVKARQGTILPAGDPMAPAAMAALVFESFRSQSNSAAAGWRAARAASPSSALLANEVFLRDWDLRTFDVQSTTKKRTRFGDIDVSDDTRGEALGGAAIDAALDVLWK